MLLYVTEASRVKIPTVTCEWILNLFFCPYLRKPEKVWGDVKAWNPMQPSELSGLSPLKYLKIERNLEILVEPFVERMEFWNKLGI